MNGKLNLLICGPLFCLLSCATTSNTVKSATEKPRSELEKATLKISPPELPEEKSIRQELEQFKSILNKKKSLSLEDWQLHARLLNYYIQLKQGMEKPNTVYIPARSRWSKRFESYCLDSRKASPDNFETLLLEKAKGNIPYRRELLELAAKNKSTSQEDIQTLIWNLHNKTIWEDYPVSLQRILLSVDPQASKNCRIAFSNL